jgi:hypothetical protein
VVRRALPQTSDGADWPASVNNRPFVRARLHTRMQQQTAALRDFESAHVRCGVNHVGATRPTSPRDVRFTSNRVRTSAPQLIDAVCQEPPNAPQQKASLENLVGTAGQRQRNGDAERTGGL